MTFAVFTVNSVIIGKNRNKQIIKRMNLIQFVQMEIHYRAWKILEGFHWRNLKEYQTIIMKTYQ